VRRRGSRPLTAAFAALLAAVLLAACGDEDGTTEGQASSPAVETSPPAGDTKAPGDPAKAQTPSSAGRSAERSDGEFEGGEESIEEFGTEASESEKDTVLVAEQAYLRALAESDFGRACSLASRAAVASLQRVVPPSARPVGCAEIMGRLLSARAPNVAREQLGGEVVRVRVEGDRSFVVFHAPGARLFVFPMVREQDGWKVSTLTSSILAPSRATLGE